MSKNIKGKENLPSAEIKDKDTLALRYSFIDPNLRGLLGKVLTVIDATTNDQIQRDALKDVMKEIFSKTHDWFREVCFTDLSHKEFYGKFGRPYPEDTIEIKN